MITSSLILAVFTIAVNVECNDENDATSSSTQDGSSRTECSIHAAEKTIILNCSGVSIQDEFFQSFDQNVDVLDASYTELRSLDVFNKKDMFRKLVVLNASHNDIKHIDEGTFNKLSYLEKIDLSFNNIEHIPDDLFMLLSDLVFLDLSNNKLTSLPNKLPMTDWFDVSNNQISSISESYSPVLYPQRVFLVGQNPFRCTCDMLWLKDLMGTRRYLIKYVKHLDAKKFFPVCNLPGHLAGKSWDSLEDEEFKCSGLAENEFESSNKKLCSNVQEVKVTVSEIGHNWLILEWKGNSDETGKVIDIKFHRFGESKELKQVILPLSASNYRLRNLEPETPYVLCFTVLLGSNSHSLGCEEIFTSKIPNQSFLNYHWRCMLQLVSDYSNHVLVLLILFITTFYVTQRKETNKDGN